MRSIRKAVTILCLSLMTMGVFPHRLWAGAMVASTASLKTGADLRTVDYERFRLDGRSTPGISVPGGFASAGASAQSTSGWSNYSTAKKTWIIVGIVAGAAIIVAVVSNHSGGGSSGGGGY